MTLGTPPARSSSAHQSASGPRGDGGKNSASDQDAGVKFGLAHDLRGPVSEKYRSLRHVWVALAPV